MHVGWFVCLLTRLLKSFDRGLVDIAAVHHGIRQSCPWVGLTRGLGWVGSGMGRNFLILVGWVGSWV